MHHSKQPVSPFHHDLSLLPKLYVDELFAQSRQQLGACDFHHGKQRVSPFYRVSQLLLEKNVFRFPQNGVLLFEGKQRVSPFYHDLGLDLVGLIGNSSIVEQLLPLVVEQLLNPILSSSHVSQKSLEAVEVIHILFRFFDFSIFHPNIFRNTISWKCFLKNDCIGSSLIECQSLLLSKVDVDPIHRILMFLPCFVHVLCKTRCFQVDRLRILVFLIQRIHRPKEYCLSVAQILTSRYQS